MIDLFKMSRRVSESTVMTKFAARMTTREVVPSLSWWRTRSNSVKLVLLLLMMLILRLKMVLWSKKITIGKSSVKVIFSKIP